MIEDDAVVAETLALYLEQAGYSVATAKNGIVGLALAREPETAAVILDLMVPGLSGHEVCRKLRAEASVPILMLTARTSETIGSKASSSAPTTTLVNRSARAK